MTDIGAPVEARMSLARIGVSFKNAYDSDEAWAIANTIAATVFAFLRNDLDATAKRIETLNKPLPGEEVRKTAVGLWLVAREALQHEGTREVGSRLAECALAAAGKQGDPLWAMAIREELLKHDQERKTDASINETPAGSRECPIARTRSFPTSGIEETCSSAVTLESFT